jgi:hypothetical protein
MKAYVGGVSTRKVDALVAALGSQSEISKYQVSRICADIDVQVQAFLSRPLAASGYDYLHLDTTYLHGRLGRAMKVCSRAVDVPRASTPMDAGSCSASRLATAYPRPSCAISSVRPRSAA